MLTRMAGAPQPTIYAPPTGLHKTSSTSTSIAFAWTGNANPVELYRNGVLIESIATGGAQSKTWTGLSAGTVYVVRIRYKGANKAGGPNYSPLTAPISMATSLPAPNQPSASVDLRDVTLTWTNTAGGVPIRVYRGASQIAELAGDSTSYVDAGLADGTYSYTLKYWLNPDLSSASTARSATVAANVNAPTSPSAAQVSGSATELALAWTVATAGSVTKVYRDTSTSPTTLVFTTAADAAAWTDTGRTRNTLYYYRLIASKAGIDSAYTSDFSATTHNAPDAAPTTPTADVTYTNQVTLAWVDGDATADIKVYRGTVANPTTLLGTVAAAVQTYVDTTVTAGVTYYYRLRALESTVYSAYTADRVAVVPTPAFGGQSITGTPGNGYVVLSWTIAAGPVSATVDTGAWDDGDGDTGTAQTGVSSGVHVNTGFTIMTKNPGITHEVTIAIPLKMRAAGGGLVLTDSSFSIMVYKDNTA